MAISSPFIPTTPLSSVNQPVKPALPVAQNNIYGSQQPAALGIEPDAQIYGSVLDDNKRDVIAIQAESLLTRERKPTGQTYDKVSKKPTYASSKIAIDSLFANKVSHSGFGSSAVQVVPSIVVVERLTPLPVAALIEADSTYSIDVAAVVTTFDTDQEESIDASATIESAYYSIVDYRWGKDAIDPDWSISGGSANLQTDTNYILAVRVRISVGANLLGSDWSIYYSTDNATWTQVENFSDVRFVDLLNFVPPPMDGSNQFSYSNFICRPGQGSHVLGLGILGTADNQSPRTTIAVTAITELESWLPIKIMASLSGEDLYFKIVSASLGTFGTGVRVLYPKIQNTPWAVDVS